MEQKSPPFEGGEAAPKAQTGGFFRRQIILTTPPARKARRLPLYLENRSKDQEPALA
jgi:hypothetical protein